MLTFSSLYLQAQDYFPLDRTHKNRFYFAGKNLATGISIRKADALGNDSIFQMNNVVTTDRDSCPYFEDPIYKSNGRNQFIDSIYKSVSMNYTFRIGNLNLYINYNPNWKLFDRYNVRNTGYFNSKNDPRYISPENISFEQVFGTTDTVITYRFYTNTIRLPQIMKVSKNHGIIIIPAFLNNSGEDMYSIEHTIPKYSDIYNYKVGDKFETRGGSSISGGLNISTCIKKYIDTTKDSASFTFFCVSYTYTQFNIKIDSSKYDLNINNYSKPLFKCLPGELELKPQFYQTYSISRSTLDTSFISYKISSFGLLQHSSVGLCKLIADSTDSSRYISSLDWTSPNPEYEIRTYTPNFGVTYYESHIGGSVYHSELTAYTSGNKTWGTVSVSQPQTSIQRLYIYPNPAQQYIILSESFNSTSRIIIHDATGRIIYKEKNTTTQSIDISTFAPGIYITEILDKNNETIAIGKFVKE